MLSIQNNQDVIAAIKKVVKFYMETLHELGDIPLAHKPKPIIEEIIIKAPKPELQEERPSYHAQHDAYIKETLAPFTKKSSVPILAKIMKEPIPAQSTEKKPLPKQSMGFVQTQLQQSVDLSGITSLDELKKKITETNICELQQFATNTVFGDGNPNAKILVIGEAPGQEEDEQGIPFCGRSGQLLMNAFASVGLKRDANFFITNNIFWRPPGNRKPTDEELLACKPYLERLCQIMQPEVIICVGAVAAQNVLQTQDSISTMRGRPFPCHLGIDTKAFCIYHPSYLLRNPSKKYEMYKDLLTMLPSISHLL